MVARTLVGGEIRSSHPPIGGVRWDRCVPAGNGLPQVAGRSAWPTRPSAWSVASLTSPRQVARPARRNLIDLRHRDASVDRAEVPAELSAPRAVMARRPKWSRTPEWNPRPTHLMQQGKRVGPIVDEVDRRPALGNRAASCHVASSSRRGPAREPHRGAPPMPVRRMIAALILSASFVAACAARGGSPGTSSAPVGRSPASAGPGEVSIEIASSASLGTFLSDAKNGLIPC